MKTRNITFLVVIVSLFLLIGQTVFANTITVSSNGEVLGVSDNSSRGNSKSQLQVSQNLQAKEVRQEQTSQGKGFLQMTPSGDKFDIKIKDS